MLDALNEQSLAQAVDHLASIDADLKAIRDTHGYPPLWARAEGFPTLIHIILEQQVSLASAQAAFDKLQAHLGHITPKSFLTLDDATLKMLGFSRQKTRYGRLLAESLCQGLLNLDDLARADDRSVHNQLVSLKGIGPWTAGIYLLMALRRPDIWPVGDLALVIAVKEVKNLAQRPDREQMEQIGEAWRPYRAVAARLLWHHYLKKRNRS